MVIADAERMAQYALTFWRRQGVDVTDELEAWITERVSEVQYLWGHVIRMNPSRGMWKELTEKLEATDPTNLWTRHYDLVYVESQILSVTRARPASARRRPPRLPGATPTGIRRPPRATWTSDRADRFDGTERRCRPCRRPPSPRTDDFRNDRVAPPCHRSYRHRHASAGRRVGGPRRSD